MTVYPREGLTFYPDEDQCSHGYVSGDCALCSPDPVKAARLEALDEAGLALAEYEIEEGRTHPRLFAKLSALRELGEKAVVRSLNME